MRIRSALPLTMTVIATTMLFACSQPMAASPASSLPSTDPMVGGAAMYPTKDIVDNAVNSADHTTLVAAVKAAGLVDGLMSTYGPVPSKAKPIRQGK